jgi:flavodoxin
MFSKLVSIIITISLAGLLIFACNQPRKQTHRRDSDTLQVKAAPKAAGQKKAEIETPEGKKMLIVYFSHTGNTRFVANMIKAKVGGDIFELKTIQPYPADYNQVVAQARHELATEFRPKLQGGVRDMDSYDVICLGFPNWCGSMPMPVFSFLEAYDFSGKAILPFCTHEGSRMGRSMEDIRALCPRSIILKSLDIRGSMVRNSQPEITAWLLANGISPD